MQCNIKAFFITYSAPPFQCTHTHPRSIVCDIQKVLSAHFYVLTVMYCIRTRLHHFHMLPCISSGPGSQAVMYCRSTRLHFFHMLSCTAQVLGFTPIICCHSYAVIDCSSSGFHHFHMLPCIAQVLGFTTNTCYQ